MSKRPSDNGGRWAFGTDGECDWEGDFDTATEAAESALEDYIDEHGPEDVDQISRSLSVGQKRRAVDLDDVIEVDDWAEQLDGVDDWCLEFADPTKLENALKESDPRGQELLASVRALLSQWLDKHDLRASHFIVLTGTVIPVLDVLPEQRIRELIAAAKGAS